MTPVEEKTSKLSGNCSLFRLTNVKGVFEHSDLKKRITCNEIGSFNCIQNTNLQSLRKKSKGQAIMIYIKKVWRLCFIWRFLRHKVSILMWKGLLCGSNPSFLYNNVSDLDTTFSLHFKYLEFNRIPFPAYFVNMIPEKPFSSTSLLKVEDS